jgi:hypothetical protein
VEVREKTMILGILVLALVITFVVAVYKVSCASPARTSDDVSRYVRPGGLEGFRELVDVADEGYLRLNLTPEAFRKTQHRRIQLLREYLKRMSHNARFLQDWANGELARSSKTRNREATDSSRSLIDLCTVFRVGAFVAQLKLLLWSVGIKLVPFVSIPCLAEVRLFRETDVLYTYERIRETANALSRACGGRCSERLEEVL